MPFDSIDNLTFSFLGGIPFLGKQGGPLNEAIMWNIVVGITVWKYIQYII